MLAEAREERELTTRDKERIADAKEGIAHYGEDTNIKMIVAFFFD